MSALLPLAYLGALLGASLCMLLVDHRFGLFYFRDWRKAAIVTVVGVGALLAWDLAGIALGIFHLGQSSAMTGILLAPHLPVEEIVFLTFLVLNTMILYTGSVEILRRRASRAAGEEGR